MATENELVYVPQQAVEPWYKTNVFWMGVGSSLLATMIFWYLLHDMESDASQDGVEPYDAMKGTRKGENNVL